MGTSPAMTHTQYVLTITSAQVKFVELGHAGSARLGRINADQEQSSTTLF